MSEYLSYAHRRRLWWCSVIMVFGPSVESIIRERIREGCGGERQNPFDGFYRWIEHQFYYRWKFSDECYKNATIARSCTVLSFKACLLSLSWLESSQSDIALHCSALQTSLRTHVQFVHQKNVAGAENSSVFSIGRSGFEKCLGHNAMPSNIVRNNPE